MKRYIRIALICGVFSILLYLIFAIYEAVYYSHTVEWKEYRNYMGLFKDSVKNNIDTNLSYSCKTKQDIYNHFIYKGSYFIVVWELKDLKNIDLSNIHLNKGLDFNMKKIKSGEILNKSSNQEVVTYYYAKFQRNLTIQVNSESNFEKSISKSNYIGFYGSVKEIALCNDKIEPQYIISCPSSEVPTLLLFYKKNDRFFLLMINSEKNMDTSMVNIFNLY